MSDLIALTDQAKQAASAYEALEKQTIDKQRERVLAYGEALSEIRKLIPSKPAFAQHLRTHGLDIRNAGFRSDAIWLAENSILLKSVSKPCPYSNPTDIRTWLRRQDPSYQPKKKNTRVGETDAAIRARDIVRPMIEKGEAISVKDLVEETGISRIVLEPAIAAERARIEAIKDVPVDVHALAEALGLPEAMRDRLHALEAKLIKQHAATYQDDVTAGIRKHLDEVVMPIYGEKLAQAELVLGRRTAPFTDREFRMLLAALHPDARNPETRAAMFTLVKSKEVLLRQQEKASPLSAGMPKTLAEMMARREETRRANSARSKAARNGVQP